MKKQLLFFWVILLIGISCLAAQQVSDSVLQSTTLQNCIQYAVNRQPLIQQAQVDEEIAETTIKSKLSEWFPQVNLIYTFQHNFEVQTNIIGGNPVKLGR